MFKNKYGRIILLIFLLFIIPASNASDNNADLIEINYGETNSNNALLNEKVNIADDIISVDSPLEPPYPQRGQGFPDFNIME